jgi:histone H3/H4
MAKKSGHLPRAAVIRLMKKAGNMRVEKGAVEELRNFLEDKAAETAKKAAGLAGFAKRKTITKEDVGLAATE